MAEKKQTQHSRVERLVKRLNEEAEGKDIEDEEYLPKELVTRIDVSEEQELPEKDSDLDSNSEDSKDEEYCEITDCDEQELVQANMPTLEILIASSQRHGDFNKAFTYQRGPKPCERTLFGRSQREQELKKATQNTPTLHTFILAVSGQPVVPPSPSLSTSERK